MKPHRTLSAALLLIFCLTLQGCGQNQINQAVALLQGLPALVQSFHLSPQVEHETLLILDEGTKAAIVFRDNPTRSNLRNAIAVFQGLTPRIHTGNPTTDARLQAIIATVSFILNAINPPAQGLIDDSQQKVSLSSEQRKIVDEKLKELERMVKP